jgi:uncharacterized protein YjbI with pentapeptide repeats
MTLTPDLSEADLSEARLAHADLTMADLHKADLSGANLTRADLIRASFIHADLTGARLDGANLRTGLVRVNLTGVDLGKADLRGVDLTGASLVGANLTQADLTGADLGKADLSGANLTGASLARANLARANLGKADLTSADLNEADLSGTRLRGANLTATRFIGCQLDGSDLTGSRVYGVSVWDASLAGATQRDLIITPVGQPNITVDNIEVAQFVYLLLNNAKIRDVIDTITSKAVLILGRFTLKRKRTLDLLRDALRSRNYLPIVFDFEKPANRDFTETVSTLAHISRFIIADLTDPRSIPQELTAIVHRLLSVPVRPLLLGDQREWAMFRDLARHPQVIEPFHYTDDVMLLSCLDSDVIEPAERRARELAGRKAESGLFSGESLP